MIQLTKQPMPQILATCGAAWTHTLVSKLAVGQEPTEAEKTRYRDQEIKIALVAETNNKCAYCESKLQHIHHGDVEHIVPKSLEVTKTFEWDNLTLACEICNQNKKNLDPNTNSIIDPYVIDPRQHLKFQGAFVFSLGTVVGECTKAILDLDRPQLIEERGERLKFIMGIFVNVLRADLPLAARRAIYKDLITRETTPSKAFSAMADDIINSMLAHIPPEVRKGIR